ncbi:LLM class oxidoreductase [Aquimarina sp. AU474]|uniref:LLM class oxidoreductase n=1 Tax=Aquimarina sp. AU474 TaxID=2108529 RepID=UPI001F47F24B|nr:LLM class oxidoreductase [Aquimarina sp. AU474]
MNVMKGFQKINKGYSHVFKANHLSLGLVVPIESYIQNSIPTMKNHIERVKLIEQFGFKALWLRDVPFHVPSFGDPGQMFDPFTYLGYLASQTKEIALGIASIALPLHHPVHITKGATTVDQLSGGRLILGIASGDRYDEYPAMGINYADRGEQFRETFNYIRKAQDDFPTFETTHYGRLSGNIDILPKATAHKIPLLMTGYSQQSLEWNAENTDGWMYYPRDIHTQKHTIKKWRELIPNTQDYSKPFMQPLYIDLQEEEDFKPLPIHLGFKTGTKYLISFLQHLQQVGVNHVALNLRFNSSNIENTLELLANKVITQF